MVKNFHAKSPKEISPRTSLQCMMNATYRACPSMRYPADFWIWDRKVIERMDREECVIIRRTTTGTHVCTPDLLRYHKNDPPAVWYIMIVRTEDGMNGKPFYASYHVTRADAERFAGQVHETVRSVD